MERLSLIANQLSSCPYTGQAPAGQCPKTGAERPPIKVTVTGAAGSICYSLVFMIGQGRMFGPHQKVDLILLELPAALKPLQGVIMELEDCSLPLISSLKGTTDQKEAFTGCQVAILVGAKPRGPGMERKDLLIENAKIFMEQGKQINEHADRNCKVLVVGNPANTNAMIVSLFTPNIPKKNITALTRLDHNRAVTQLATKIKANVDEIKNLTIWGNHSTTQFPDISQGFVLNHPTKTISTSLRSAIGDDKWVQENFIPRVQKRGAEIIAARKFSSAASAANAVCDHIFDWVVGTRPGETVSMAVISDGSYGVPKGLNFSYPVICKNGEFEIVQGYKFDTFGKDMIEKTTKELVEERDMVLAFLNNKQ